MESVLYVQLQALDDPNTYPSAEPRLLNAKVAAPAIAAAVHNSLQTDGPVLCSHTAYFGALKQCSRSDVVIVTINDVPEIGEVWFHAQVQDVCVTCVSVWQRLGGNRFKVQNGPVLVLTSTILDTCIHTRVDDVALVVPNA